MTPESQSDPIHLALQRQRWWAHVGRRVRKVDRYVLVLWCLTTWALAMVFPALVTKPGEPLSIAALIAAHLGLAPLWWAVWKLGRPHDLDRLATIAGRVGGIDGLRASGIAVAWNADRTRCTVRSRNGVSTVTFDGHTVEGLFAHNTGKGALAAARLRDMPPSQGLWGLDGVTVESDGRVSWRVALSEGSRGAGDVEAAVVSLAISRLDPACDLIEDNAAKREIAIVDGAPPQNHDVIAPIHVLGTLTMWSLALAVLGAYAAHKTAIGHMYFMLGSGSSGGSLIAVLAFIAGTMLLFSIAWADRLKPVALWRAQPKHAPEKLGTLKLAHAGMTLQMVSSETTIDWATPFASELSLKPGGARTVCFVVRQGTEEIALTTALPEEAIPEGTVLLDKSGTPLPKGLFVEVMHEVRRFEALQAH